MDICLYKLEMNITCICVCTYKSILLARLCCLLRLNYNSEDDKFASPNTLISFSNKTFKSAADAELNSFPSPFLFLMYHKLILSRIGQRRKLLSEDKTGWLWGLFSKIWIQGKKIQEAYRIDRVPRTIKYKRQIQSQFVLTWIMLVRKSIA